MVRPGYCLILGLLVAFQPAAVRAQDEGIENSIEQSRSGASIRDLKAQARAEPPTTSNRHALSVFYHRRAQAQRRLGNYSGVIADLQLALEYSRVDVSPADFFGGRIFILKSLAYAYEDQGDWFSAIEAWQRVVREYPQGFAYQEGLLRIMNAHSLLGQRAEAERMRQEADAALGRMRNLPDTETFLYSRLHLHSVNMGLYFAQQGDHAETEKRYRDSLELAEKYHGVAERRFPKGHPQVLYAADRVASAKLLMANVLATRGKYGEAEAFARAGFQDQLARHGFNTIAVARGLSGVGWARLQQGDASSAERYFRYARAAVEGAVVLPHSTVLAAHRANLAGALVVQGRWNDALKSYEERDQGLRSDAEQFKRTGSNHVGWAYALLKTGQSQRAAQMAGAMAAGVARRPVPDRWYLAQLRGVLGMALAANGRAADALKAYRESIPDLIRRGQDDAAEENTGYWRAFWQRAILEGYLELLGQLRVSGDAPADLDLVEESFRTADVARGSLVQEAIAATAVRAQLPDANLAALARREHDALNRIVALNKVLAYLASSGEERRTKLVADVQADIDRLRKERVQLRIDISNRYPEYAELIDPKPVGISDVRKALAPGEALVSIYLGESQSYVWTIASDGRAAFRVVPVRREEIERDVHQIRRALDFGDGSIAQIRPFDLARAHKLYRAYFEPDEALWKDAQVLNVVPHGALGELPFSLLVTAPSQQPMAGAQSAYADVPWLMRKAAIAQLPSASAFAALRRAPSGKSQRQPFIGFGDPLFTDDPGAGAGGTLARNLALRKAADTGDDRLNAAMRSGGKEPRAATPVSSAPTLAQAFARLSSLPDTSEELREIAITLKADPARNVFLDRRATEKNVKQTKLENTRVLAFATHGIAPGELTGLDQPALALSNPALTGDSGNDGFLTMEEVLGLKLDADWVVLSACNTGSADGRGSEAVSGLGRAFFYAGARSLLVSNWAVETTSARLLTTELFKRQAANPQLTRAEALRQSMVDLIGKTAAGGFSYAHPAFWAPFSLVGDGGR